MKKSLQSLVLLLMALMMPMTAMAAYDQLADGVYMDGTTLYITSGVTSLSDLQVDPSEIYCYATIPPACVSNTFTGYGATLHVPAAGMVSYFTALYWYNFNNILSDAIEPLSVTMNTSDAELEIGQQLSLSATVAPSDATPKTVYWSSTDSSVATVNAGGTVTTVAVGECDILATCVDKVAVCHVNVVSPRVTITLDKHEVQLLPNHTITLTATCSPVDVDLSVTSSNPSVAIPRIVNGTIMVVGVAEGTATITVNAADGWGHPDACEVIVYTEPGDVNCDGYVNISDVTALIDYLLSVNPSGVNLTGADCNNDGNINISDVTTLIDFLLSGRWPWEEIYTVNGVSFKMIPVEGGTFTMGATTEQGSDANSDEYPTHQVTLSSYCIGQTEVTQELWLAVMGSNPSEFSGDQHRPVERVSWYDCQTFITKLNQMTGKQFRLPTEAEWEYAARGGNQSKGYKYAGSNTISDVAWYWDNIPSQNENSVGYGTQAVASKSPNELGLYDMSGNVWEWCLDWFGNYSDSEQTDPVGPITDLGRVSRGGGWFDEASGCRVSNRLNDDPTGRSDNHGLRLALDDENSPKFRLSETVITLMIGESKSVDIFNGNGDYTVEGGSDNVTTSISGDSLTLTGTNEGTTTVHITNTSTGANAVLSVIVEKPDIQDETFTVNGVAFKMIAVEGGTFMMGASDDDEDAIDYEKPAHQVVLSSFSIGQTEVTQELWQAVMGSNPSWCSPRWDYSENLQRPVEMVRWNDCQEFIAKLNELTGKTFRLPTEAEWEYAARGGNKSQGYKFSGSNDINAVAWYYGNIPSQEWGTEGCSSRTVATKAPNELGLYDMTGNVSEWVNDWYGIYSSETQTNPTGPASGSNRVARGGYWGHTYWYCRVSYRADHSPTYKSYAVGLRLAL